MFVRDSVPISAADSMVTYKPLSSSKSVRVYGLNVMCLFEGKPRPSLSWWRDYAIIDDTFEFDDREGMVG